jgi:hypothetical protein
MQVYSPYGQSHPSLDTMMPTGVHEATWDTTDTLTRFPSLTAKLSNDILQVLTDGVPRETVPWLTACRDWMKSLKPVDVSVGLYMTIACGTAVLL